jgi:hypothetical protein
MQAFAKFLLWIFALSAAICLQTAFTLLRAALRFQNDPRFLRSLIVPAAFLVMAFIFATAWWTLWRRRTSGRKWAVAASLINVATGVWPFLTAPREVLASFGVVGALSVFGSIAGLGIAGVVVFLRHEKAPDPGGQAELSKIPGDGTHPLLNKSGSVLITICYLGAWQWWIHWATEHRVPGGQWALLVILLAGFLMTLVHELGHTAAGFALGMKLRLFIVGPFQWRKREGRWEFKFDPRSILSDTGGTGVVPTTASQPQWYEAVVLIAGPLANLTVAAAAFSVALVFDPRAPIQSYGFAALFGAFNLLCFATNLIPLRTGNQYSDGARLYQLFSHGPWADFYRAVSVVTSSLVTPLRPRDYDMGAIERASAGIQEGVQALLLRLYAYGHYLDSGMIPEARTALTEAESICNTSVPNLPVELHTVFVFGNAYLKRDAAATRHWWDRMTAKKPTRFNVDYWRAKSALHWIEGSLAEARDAWEKSDRMAAQLPKSGVYEFDRYCCALLGDALGVSHLPVAATASLS